MASGVSNGSADCADWIATAATTKTIHRRSIRETTEIRFWGPQRPDSRPTLTILQLLRPTFEGGC